MTCQRCLSQKRRPNKLDHCPVCGRHILDMDMTGCEDDDAQRWCVVHLSDGHNMAYLKEEK
jgi:hypothetical protein